MIELLAAACSAAMIHSAGASQGEPLLDRLQRVEFAMEGYYAHYLYAASRNWIQVFEERNPRMMEIIANRENSRERHLVSWDGEYAGKLLLGSVEVQRLMGDKGLREHIDGFIGRLERLQAEDGYLGIWSKQYRMSGFGETADGITGTCDPWCHYYLMVGLLMWHEDTGDERSLRMAKRMGDLMCDAFLGRPEIIATKGDPRFNSSAAHGMLALYRAIPDERYLRLAREIVDDSIVKCGFDFVNRALQGKEFYTNPTPHASRWESYPGITAYPELYYLTGDRKYADAFKQIWWSVTKTDRHNNGGVTSMEHTIGNPYDVRAVELCCTVAYMAMSVEMLRLTGDSIAADELELSTMNAALAFWARSGKWMTYNTPMEGIVVPCAPWEPDPHENTGLYCCTSYAPRGLGLLSEWAVMRDSEGPVVNWYGPGSMSVQAGGEKVSLIQETDYPRTGDIRITVSLPRPTLFTLKLRLPHWSKGTSLVVNGKSVRARAGGYASIRRIWREGDVIELRLDMTPHSWVGANEYQGRTCIYRGPVLLALPRKPVTEQATFDADWQPVINLRETQYFSLMGSSKPSSRAAFEFRGDRVGWRYNRFNSSGKAEVRIDGRVVDVVAQYAPNDGFDMFAYDRGEKGLFLSESREYKGLGPGTHRLEITVLAQKNPKSSGTRITIRDFLTEGSDPIIDARNATFDLLPPSDPSGLDVRLQVTDTLGRKVMLVDYDTASKDEKPFVTWLRVENTPKSRFSRRNTTRSAVTE